MTKNIFIVVEGIDGSGKGEVVKRLHNYLFSKKKYRILETREPTSGKYGIKIRDILRSGEHPLKNKELLLELFIKDREEHLKNTIKPFLNSKSSEPHIVICDRYYHSTIAFQQAQGLNIERLIEKNKNFIKPDITFILDVEPEIALKRIEGREKEKLSYEKFERKDFMDKVRKNFLGLSEVLDEKIRIVDASKNIEHVLKDIASEVDALLK